MWRPYPHRFCPLPLPTFPSFLLPASSPGGLFPHPSSRFPLLFCAPLALAGCKAEEMLLWLHSSFLLSWHILSLLILLRRHFLLLLCVSSGAISRFSLPLCPFPILLHRL